MNGLAKNGVGLRLSATFTIALVVGVVLLITWKRLSYPFEAEVEQNKFANSVLGECASELRRGEPANSLAASAYGAARATWTGSDPTSWGTSVVASGTDGHVRVTIRFESPRGRQVSDSLIVASDRN